MDRKSFLVITGSLAVLFGANYLIDKAFPPIPRPRPVPAAIAAASAPGVGADALASNAPGAAGASPAAFQTGPVTMPAPSASAQTLSISNQDILLNFTSHGGGIKSVELLRSNYLATTRQQRGQTVTTNRATIDGRGYVPILALLGGAPIEGDLQYTLTREGQTVRAEKTLTNGLRIVKEVKLGADYLFDATIRIENTGAAAVIVPAQDVIVGTAYGLGPTEDQTVVGAYWHDGRKLQTVNQSWFDNRTMGCFAGTPRLHYAAGVGNVAWAAVHSQFFTLALIPNTNTPEVIVDHVLLPAQSPSDSMMMTNGFQTALAYPGAVLEPGKSLTRTYTVYAGPKEYNGLAKIAQKMGNNLDEIMDFGFFGFFSKFLLLSMNGLHAIAISGHALPYGVAIILITIIIKTLFWPLTLASTRSMKRMQALQPQLKAINEKYKDDAQKRNQKTMELWKEHKVNPAGGCLPMLLQIPVFIGFYYMLRNAIELRGETFLWAADLSRPDTIGYLGVFPLNPLPLLMAATTIWQSTLTPTSPGMDPSQQKIMKWGLPLMMLFVLYNMSAGLTLYWTVQNLLTVLQTKLTKTNDVAAPGLKAVPRAPQKKK